jgi:O-antigen ligase
MGSVIFSFRAITSITIGLIPIAGIIKNKIEKKSFLNSRLKNLFFLFCCLFFLIQLISLLYAQNIHQGWRNIQLKTGLVLIPFAIGCCDYIDKTTRRQILKWYCMMLWAACLIAIGNAIKSYTTTGNSSVFFYHKLVSLYSGHAIQFSILVFIGVVYLFETFKKKEFIFQKKFHVFLAAFFVLFLFLLSSKLVIGFLFVYFLFTMIGSSLNRSVSNKFIATAMISFVIVSGFIFSTPNAINNRFRDIAETNFSFLKKEKYNPAEYFNGLEFRLLQWRFVPQLLNERKAWINGVSVGDAQDMLNQKYKAENMYIGSPERKDKGFIGYNTHNEFLESLLQSGLVGLLFFILISWSLIKMIWKEKRNDLSFVTILLMAYSCTESVLESQYSLFIFLFFPLFFFFTKNDVQQ